VEKASIIRHAWTAFEPVLTTSGYELVEVEYGMQNGQAILCIYIDKSGGGIGLDDCTAVSQLLSPLLDREEFIAGNYVLEVSSPGVERPLRKAVDFERFAGEPVRLHTHGPVSGRKKFTGMLRGFKDGLIALECDGVVHEIDLENLKKANLNR
jgi:ribosome maturation factor RimP